MQNFRLVGGTSGRKRIHAVGHGGGSRCSKKTLNATLSKKQNQEFLQQMRGTDGCNVRKAGGRVGYVYTKPAAEKEPETVYTQEVLDFVTM